jgi:hypothetical protein
MIITEGKLTMHQKFLTTILLTIGLSATVTPTLAAPESVSVSVTEVRPYITGDIFVAVNSTQLCDTNVFRISATAAGQKAMYAAVLLAFSTAKKIRLEAANATGCAGWGTQLQSVYLVSN